MRKNNKVVIVYNLGGPGSLDDVRGFLFNLFYDKAIIRLPNPFRWLLAKLISKRRTPVAREIYEQMGGKSPILTLTQEQALALESQLEGYDVLVAMRYSSPTVGEVAQKVRESGYDKVVLLPLYPQFSTTTTGSFLACWQKYASDIKNVFYVCCYPTDPLFIESHVSLLSSVYEKAKKEYGLVRVLFSAHGLPKKIVDAGDPYPLHIEKTVSSIMQAWGENEVDHHICYQSRVGPLEWIGPSTDDEVERAGRDGICVVLVPIAFVSEHSETLVELDIEYRDLAISSGVSGYYRVPALNAEPTYIQALASLVKGEVGVMAPLPLLKDFSGRYCCRKECR